MSSMAPKAGHDDGLDSAIRSAPADIDLTDRRRAVGRLITAVFEIRTLQEAEKLAKMLSAYYPAPSRVASGIWELLSNAVEHGNLEISFEEKSSLLQSGAFANEVDRRSRLPEYSERTVRVEFARMAETIELTIVDQGRGFDFVRYMNTDQSTECPNGRGIIIASKVCFDALDYQGCGNRVTATVVLPK
jgi:anti-sigma regulatory factor (Ser/Thr protein kinase)